MTFMMYTMNYRLKKYQNYKLKFIYTTNVLCDKVFIPQRGIKISKMYL